MRYRVVASRWERGWELDVGDDVGVTQCRRLSRAKATVIDYIELKTGVAITSDDIDLVIQMDPETDRKIWEAREATRQALVAQGAAAARSRGIARELKRKGLSGADIAVVLGVSAQRVSALLSLHREAAA